MRLFVFTLLLISFVSCKKANGIKLEEYASNYSQSEKWLIACAAGSSEGFNGNTEKPVSVFFYPQDGATDFKYFATKNIKENSTDFSNYREYEGLTSVDVFNGYLKKFEIETKKEHWGIITYVVGDSLRVSDPIKIQHDSRKTETEPNLISITENGTEPMFTWEDGTHKENIIYFQVISDQTDNLISGTYTTDKFFTFYDLSNVVINIKESPEPFLENGSTYNFTLMSVSDDNWVNVAATKNFTTN